MAADKLVFKQIGVYHEMHLAAIVHKAEDAYGPGVISQKLPAYARARAERQALPDLL